MAAFINTNISSLNAQRNLNASQGALQTSLQRLSSGLRINSAKDDAAGLGISERMTSQIRGLNQASRNANDGISLAQTTEGALGEITNNLQRIRELAVQAANATNSASDRAALNQEVQQRLAEVNRVATQTAFNGQKVLDGSFGTAAFQVGANVDETISVNLSTSMKTADIGAYVSQKSNATQTAGTAATSSGAWGSGAYQTNVASYTGVDTNAWSAGGLQINGTDIKASGDYAHSSDTTYRGGSSAYAKAAAINASGVAGVSASATNVQTFDDNAVAADTFLDLTAGTLGATDSISYTLTVNGEKVFDDASVTASGITMDAAISAINTKQFDTGVVASKDENGKLVLTAADGRDIKVEEEFVFADGATVADNSNGVVAETVFSTQTITDDATDSADGATLTQGALTFKGSVTLNASADVTINSGQAYIGMTSAILSASGSMEAQSVTSIDNANKTILAVDAALNTVSTLRSTLGAVQNRFESTIANLQATSENLSASRSRIQDADFAAETATLTRGQILQQAGTAMLAQANSLPNGVLALLRG
ncbi:MAG TPA: flagellin [Noviherbaspirillum sp.]|nr:flagellin [Noviherbaspirillum sp.]